jgi:hypothetical protein
VPTLTFGVLYCFFIMSLTAETTSAPNFESRSNKRNLCAGAYGHASRICCTTQSIGISRHIEVQDLAPVVADVRGMKRRAEFARIAPTARSLQFAKKFPTLRLGSEVTRRSAVFDR